MMKVWYCPSSSVGFSARMNVSAGHSLYSTVTPSSYQGLTLVRSFSST